MTKYFKGFSDSNEESIVKKKEISVYKLPPMFGFISEFLIKKEILKTGRISFQFLKNLSFLKKIKNSENYKYEVPWIIILGEERSGKTTLLKNISRFAIKNYHENKKFIDEECNWFFLENGIGLDVKGDFFLKKNSLECNESGWFLIENLLLRYRSGKPIDSIILTVSIEDFYGSKKLSEEMCERKGEYLSSRLTMFLNRIRLDVPVYIVFTKTDIIPGFSSFCESLTKKFQNEIFGWSSPYSPEKTFSKSWVDEAFNNIFENLKNLSMKLLLKQNEYTDSIFVFQNEFIKIKKNITIFFNAIFSKSAKKNFIIMRGFYFTGIGNEDLIFLKKKIKNEERNELERNELKNELNSNLINESSNELNRRNQLLEEIEVEKMKDLVMYEENEIFFFFDLIFEKILPEYSLASPQRGRVLTANKNLNVAKILTISFLATGSYNLYYINKSLFETKKEIMLTFETMNSFFLQIQKNSISEIAKKRNFFEESISHFAEVMQNFGEAKLKFFWLPPSWFSPIKKEINKAINVSFQNVIMRSIYVNILLKARELFNSDATKIPNTGNLANLIMPTLSNEFIAMRKYVNDLDELDKYVQKFNSLRISPSQKVLDELAFFCFKITLSEDFRLYYNKMKNNLISSKIPAISLSQYKTLARQTFGLFFQHFFNTIFIPSYKFSLPSRIELVIEQLSNPKLNILPDLDLMREFCTQLNEIVEIFPENSDTWIDKEIFEPSSDYDLFLSELDNSNFFGEEISQIVVDNCAVGMRYLQKKLDFIKRKLFSDGRINLKKEVGVRKYSSPIIQITNALTELFSEQYMVEPETNQFISKIPDGETLYWDDKLLKVASDMCVQFDEFSSKKIGSFPLILQEGLRILARSALQKNLISLIGKAQNFVRIPTNIHSGLSIEEFIRSKSANLRDASPYLIRLLTILNYESVSFFYVTLRDLLLNSNYWLLHRLNELLKKIGPYHISDPTFSWWNGKTDSALIAYNLKDDQDLKSYLENQGAQVIKLAITLGKPIIDFLTSDVLMSVNPLDRNLLSKWKRILEQTEAYQTKQAGNSISMLETFISNELKTYSIDNAFDLIQLNDVLTENGDLFLETIQFIKRGVLGRIEILKRNRSISNYNKLKDFFNKKLRGKFPFTVPALDASQSFEADPEDIRAFFEMFDEFGGASEKILDEIFQFGAIAEEPFDFLAKMENVKDLLHKFLISNVGGAPSIDYTISFRSNQLKEKGGNMVAEWTISSNFDETLSSIKNARGSEWRYGNPTIISFRWPDLSEQKIIPTNDPRQPNLQVDDKTAYFNFGGFWSILRMIRKHIANRGEYIPSLDSNTIVLKFIIPLANDERAIVFNSISLFGSGENGKVGKSIPFPHFPLVAPNLNFEILKYQNDPVISYGLIKASDILLKKKNYNNPMVNTSNKS